MLKKILVIALISAQAIRACNVTLEDYKNLPQTQTPEIIRTIMLESLRSLPDSFDKIDVSRNCAQQLFAHQIFQLVRAKQRPVNLNGPVTRAAELTEIIKANPISNQHITKPFLTDELLRRISDTQGTQAHREIAKYYGLVRGCIVAFLQADELDESIRSKPSICPNHGTERSFIWALSHGITPLSETFESDTPDEYARFLTLTPFWKGWQR